MIHILRRHGQEFELRRRAARNLEDALRFRSRGYAYSFLRRFLQDPLNAHALRRVYAETHAFHDTHERTQQELLDALAWDLVSGTLTINARPRRHHEWLSLAAEEAPPPLASSVPRPAAARPPVAHTPAPRAPETAVEAAVQAASLQAAAQKGAPFCEACERAKKQAQQNATAT